MTEHAYRPPEFDGLVVEDPNGVRLLAIPAALLPVLRSAAVLRFRAGDAVYNMRVARDQLPAARAEQTPAIDPPERSNGSAPTPTYGAPAIPVSSSPAPPPPPEQDPEDPANIPLRVWRNGHWENTYVTRAEYERYETEGKISHQAPPDRPDEGATK